MIVSYRPLGIVLAKWQNYPAISLLKWAITNISMKNLKKICMSMDVLQNEMLEFRDGEEVANG
jgi:hypothetical protein